MITAGAGLLFLLSSNGLTERRIVEVVDNDTKQPETSETEINSISLSAVKTVRI